MKQPTWHDTRLLLRQRCAVPPPPPREAFWSQAWRRLPRQTSPAAPGRRADLFRLPIMLAWSTATALLIAGFFVTRLFGPSPTVHSGAVAAAGPNSMIEDVQVLVGYRGLIIVDDTQRQGTLVWIDGLAKN